MKSQPTTKDTKGSLPKRRTPAASVTGIKTPATRGKRSYVSTIINLSVLIALFTFVFALQHISTGPKHDSKPDVNVSESSPDSEATEREASTRGSPAAPESLTVKTAVVDMPNNKAARSAKTFAPQKPARAATRATSKQRNYRGAGWKDRQQSARLVEQLDGGYRRADTKRSATHASYAPASPTQPRYAQPAYRTSTTRQPSGSSYGPSTYTTNSARPYTTTTHDLDSEIARQRYLDENRGLAAAPPPSYRTRPLAMSSPPPACTPQPSYATQQTYITQPSSPAGPTYTTGSTSSKPAWEVTTGD